jgi:2-C-methyl-D-erythritol 4-phosphate cytidylyltransferase/2-C-methyl-D-erythritol 2,4-cyclodiphosphate synthase
MREGPGRAAALIMAAGRGERMGADRPKCFLPLAGVPLYLHSLRACAAVTEITTLVLVVPAGCEAEAAAPVKRLNLPLPVAVVPGGANRAESVRAGLAVLEADPPELVAILDGARPFVTPRLIAATLAEARRSGASLAATPLADTLKRAGPDLVLAETLDRTGLWRAQTPQTFRYDLIVAAHRQAQAEGWPATDDAMLVERAGHPVTLCPAEEGNLKVTTPKDLERAERLLAARERRVGQGSDLHRLVAGRPLIVAGVAVPYERGLLGHSDGDVACHALADALLGAAALGDIGVHFPDTDPAYAGADSAELLQQVAGLVAAAGYRLVNCDVTLHAEAPKFRPYVEAMRDRLAAVLGVSREQVSVKAKTGEGLGQIGQGQAMAAEAIVLVERQG